MARQTADFVAVSCCTDMEFQLFISTLVIYEMNFIQILLTVVEIRMYLEWIHFRVNDNFKAWSAKS